MSSLIVFRRVAKRELDDAILWYECRREGLGQEFSLAVEKQLARIASDHRSFRTRKRINQKIYPSPIPIFNILPG